MLYAGVDGCKGGWFVALLDGERAGFDLCLTFKDVWERFRHARRLFVDIPIGLPADHVRLADIEARQALPTGRKSSIFNTPVRSAVYAPGKSEAKKTNRKLTGKSLSEQSLSIMPKIREVDTVMQTYPETRERVFEAHPEVCFGALADVFPKDPKRDSTGAAERLNILMNFEKCVAKSMQEALNRFPRILLAQDDILDAFVLAVAARESGDAPQFFPGGMDTPPTDETGLPMAIWHPGLPDQGADT